MNQPGEQRPVLDHQTSDDLAACLSDKAQLWRLRVCKYKLLNPMSRRIDGFEEAPEFDLKCGGGPVARRRPQRVDREVAAELDELVARNALGDPLAAAASKPLPASAREARRAERPNVSARRDALPEASPSAPPPIADQGDSALSDEEDIFGPAEPDEDADDACPHLLEAPPAGDQVLEELSAGLFAEAVLKVELESAEPLAGDDVLPPAFGMPNLGTRASDGTAEGRPTTSGVALANNQDEVGELASLIDVVVEMSGVAGSEAHAGPSAVSGAGSSTDAPAALAASASSAQDGAETTPAAPVTEAPPPPPQGQPIAGGPGGWWMTPGGYVFSSSGRYQGRITQWGRYVSVKCASHGCSKAKRRERITDGEICHWLLRGMEEFQVGVGAPVKEMKREHEKLWPL